MPYDTDAMLVALETFLERDGDKARNTLRIIVEAAFEAGYRAGYEDGSETSDETVNEIVLEIRTALDAARGDIENALDAIEYELDAHER